MNRYSIAIFATGVVLLVVAVLAPKCADTLQCSQADYFQRVSNGR